MVVLVVDVANVMGSRPDGWWRDRAGAATRLMAELAPLRGARLTDLPSGSPIPVGKEGHGGAGHGGVGGGGVANSDGLGDGGQPGAPRAERLVAVLEGRSRAAEAPEGVEVVLAPADGDTTIVEVAHDVLATGRTPLVVTADRGLRARLPQGARVAGPGWLLGHL